MSLSEDLRNELAAIAPARACCRLAELSALFHSAGALHLQGRGEVAVHLDLSSSAAARRAFVLLRDSGVASEIRTYRRTSFDRATRYQLHVSGNAGALGLLREAGVDVPVVVGGIIPAADARKLQEDMQVGPYLVPAGTVVAPNIFLTHRRADIYPDPLSFRPERFIDDKPEMYAWLPFGGGIRRCVGAEFALMEMRIAIPEILRRVIIEAASPKLEKIRRRAVTLAPANGTRVVVRERTPTLPRP